MPKTEREEGISAQAHVSKKRKTRGDVSSPDLPRKMAAVQAPKTRETRNAKKETRERVKSPKRANGAIGRRLRAAKERSSVAPMPKPDFTPLPTTKPSTEVIVFGQGDFGQLGMLFL